MPPRKAWIRRWRFGGFKCQVSRALNEKTFLMLSLNHPKHLEVFSLKEDDLFPAAFQPVLCKQQSSSLESNPHPRASRGIKTNNAGGGCTKPQTPAGFPGLRQANLLQQPSFPPLLQAEGSELHYNGNLDHVSHRAAPAVSEGGCGSV